MHDSIAVAMSGGVDSSVAAWLLRQQGEQAVGVTMRLFVPEDLAPGQREQCHILEDLQDAQTVAGQPAPSKSRSWSPLSRRMSRDAPRTPV